MYWLTMKMIFVLKGNKTSFCYYVILKLLQTAVNHLKENKANTQNSLARPYKDAD